MRLLYFFFYMWIKFVKMYMYILCIKILLSFCYFVKYNSVRFILFKVYFLFLMLSENSI